MSTHLSVGAVKALPISASDRDPATIINSSGGTLYYKNASDVDSGDDSLANGSSVEVTEPNWIIGSASTHVLVLRNDDRGDSPYPESREPIRTVAGPVKSGTQTIGGTLAGVAETDTVLYDKTTKSFFVNEGTAASPYWSPIAIGANMTGVIDNMTSVGLDSAIADTTAAKYTGAGTRVFGQGIEQADSGLIPGTAVEGDTVAQLVATNEASHVAALGSPAGIFQPDTHGTCVVDIEWAQNTAITLRTAFVGFIGTAADALDPAVTSATTTATFQQDDLVGVLFDVGLTDGDRWFTVSEKGNAAGTQDLSATGDTSVDVPAAATYQRVRVEVRADGTAYVWFDKTLFGTVIAGASGAGAHASAISFDVDEEFSPVAYLESTSAATKTADVKRFSYWGTRA
jgi:hypothetical protein